MTTVNCIIIDDEPFARELLQIYIEKIPFIKLLNSCSSVIEAMTFLNDNAINKIDLIITDIDMPDISGMEFIKGLQQKYKVIFITAHSGYAIDGFEVNAVDYIVKPVSFERFLKSIIKVRDSLNTKKPMAKEELFVKDGHKFHKINYLDIAYLEGMRDYVKIVKNDSHVIITHSTLKSMLDELPDYFLRIHKSFIVNKQYISSIFGNMIELKKIEIKIPIGKQYKEEVLNKLNINT